MLRMLRSSRVAGWWLIPLALSACAAQQPCTASCASPGVFVDARPYLAAHPEAVSETVCRLGAHPRCNPSYRLAGPSDVSRVFIGVPEGAATLTVTINDRSGRPLLMVTSPLTTFSIRGAGPCHCPNDPTLTVTATGTVTSR